MHEIARQRIAVARMRNNDVCEGGIVAREGRVHPAHDAMGVTIEAGKDRFEQLGPINQPI